MLSSNNELIVHRGETFSIDRTVQNRDGSPFVVGKLENPYLLITVASSKFATENGYERRYFLPLFDIVPTFKATNVIPLEEILNANGEVQYTSFPNTYPTGIYKGKNIEFDEDDDAVFSLNTTSGKVYKYRKQGTWVDYSFRFVFTFPSSETKDWIAKTYYYSIQLISGTISENGSIDVYDYVIPLLNPTKISVLSNLEGRLK